MSRLTPILKDWTESLLWKIDWMFLPLWGIVRKWQSCRFVADGEDEEY